MQTQKNAFTLIELSIVLVIIGLIIGSVLVGRDLIASAELRSTLADISRYSAAMNTFKIKYNCIAGDCASATQIGVGTPGGPGDNGNGDESIVADHMMYNSGNGYVCKESMNVWYHLGKAGLVKGEYKGFNGESTYPGGQMGYTPLTAVGSQTYIHAMTLNEIIDPVWTHKLGNSFLLASTTMQVWGDASITPILTASQAYWIDNKLDDGQPISGIVQTVQTGLSPGPQVTVSAWGCSAYDYGSNLWIYDVKGHWDNFSGSAVNTPDNPNQIRCSIGVGKAW